MTAPVGAVCTSRDGALGTPVSLLGASSGPDNMAYYVVSSPPRKGGACPTCCSVKYPFIHTVEICAQLLCRIRDAKFAFEGAVETRFSTRGDVEKAIPLLCGSSVDGFEIVFATGDR